MERLNSFLNWIREILSDNGRPSSTRVLMFIFSFFSMHLIWRIFYHIFQIKDPALVSLWLGALPLIFSTLMGFIILPYSVNKGASAVTELINSLEHNQIRGFNKKPPKTTSSRK